MTASHTVLALLAAVLVFWIVGAYNRMVRLRSEVVARFAPLDAHLRERHALLQRQLELQAEALVNAAPRLEALGAASRQADAAREHARARPGAPGALTSLRVAEDILADARARLPLPAGGSGELPEVQTRLAAADTALAFARREFNATVVGYNAAVHQFPTLVLARVFGFRPAGVF